MHKQTTINIPITNDKTVTISNHNHTAAGMVMVNIMIEETGAVTITGTGVVMTNVLKIGIGFASRQAKTKVAKGKAEVMVDDLPNIAGRMLMQTTERINFNIISSIIYNRKGCCKAAFLSEPGFSRFY
jgi:hypothetical protein